MRRTLLTIAIALALFGGTAAFSGQAQAGTLQSEYGYVCTASFYPFSNSYYGNFGMVGMTIYTGPACTGTYVTWVSLYSTGATNQGLATLYDQPTLLRLAQAYANRVGTSNYLYLLIDSSSQGLYYGEL